ncbi:MAG TPA: hypothetical protein VFV38_16050 [Ktedonobacteraceae bacterium]|nr:hypothetical protein [Ktedonobacteraceae bacterium]
MRASLTASFQLLRSCAAGFDVEEEASSAQPLIARCFLHVSAPPERSDQARLRITALLPQVHNLTLGIPLARDPQRGFLSWFEISLALLPNIPLRITIDGPVLVELGLDVVMELANEHVQIRDAPHQAVNGEPGEIMEDDVFWFDSLGYQYLQAPWLLQLGGYLVQHHDPGNAYQTVRYPPDRQMYEYRLHFVSARETPQDYRCLHDDLRNIEWEHALDLKRFALGFSVDAGMKQQRKRSK